MENITVLKPVHTSPETAYLIEDYPYGFTLRCQKRVWIEQKGNEYRIVEQTTNPKVEGVKWNAPKKSTYGKVCVLFIDNETGYLHATRYFDFEKAHLEKFKDALDAVNLARVVRSIAMEQVHYTEGIKINVDKVKFYVRVNEVLEEMGYPELKF